MTDEVTRDGKYHIERWLHARKSLDQAKSQVNRAECELMNATNELGKWLLPPDAKKGEKIAVWHGDSLIQAEVTDRDPIVTIRTRGKSLMAA